jgi:hypothetical protein
MCCGVNGLPFLFGLDAKNRARIALLDLLDERRRDGLRFARHVTLFDDEFEMVLFEGRSSFRYVM